MEKEEIVTWGDDINWGKLGHTRFLFENWYGIKTKGKGRHKVERLRNMVIQLEVDRL